MCVFQGYEILHILPVQTATNVKLITQILHKFKDNLGPDYESYHNHAQRVYHFATTLLLMRESKKVAISAAFHDLDIWVNDNMDYLNGSENLARQYLLHTDYGLLPDEIAFIINQHHKLTKIKGNIEAEAFRKADLMDLTAGKIRFNLPLSLIRDLEDQYPRKGFTKMIFGKTFRHAVSHPLNPFPMIKW